MQRPTAESIRLWSQVTATDWAAAGYPVSAPDRLDLVTVPQAIAYVQMVTGRKVADIDPDVDPDIAALMEQAIRLRVEQLVYLQVKKVVEGASSETYITSFSVPGYSESRAMRPSASSSTTKRPSVNPWALLDELLWLLMTPAQAEYWVDILTGVHAPSFEMVELDWSGNRGMPDELDVPFSASSRPGWGGL